VLDHRPTVEVSERLAGKTRGGESSGDDDDGLEWEVIDPGPSRCRVHVE